LPAEAGRVGSVRHYTGMPVDARFVSEEILSQERSVGPSPRRQPLAERVTR
jgi:hypothetical protein